MKKDDKNLHSVLLIIDISKHGAKEMGYVKMAGPGFVNDVYSMMTRFGPKNKTGSSRVQTFFAGSVCTQCSCACIVYIEEFN